MSSTDAFFPHRTVILTLTEEPTHVSLTTLAWRPTRTKLRTENELPMQPKFNTETAPATRTCSPKRATDREEPSLTSARTETDDPNSVCPFALTAAPIRANLRTEKAEAQVVNSNTERLPDNTFMEVRSAKDTQDPRRKKVRKEIEEAALTKLHTDTLLPRRENVRTEKLLPETPKLRTDRFPAILTNRATLKDEPTRAKERSEKLEAQETKSQALRLRPRRTNCRRERDEPMCAASIIDIPVPRRVNLPETDNPLPARAKFRQEIELPICRKSKTEQADPSRTNERTEAELPT
jgi:hypothetical protein